MICTVHCTKFATITVFVKVDNNRLIQILRYPGTNEVATQIIGFRKFVYPFRERVVIYFNNICVAGVVNVSAK